MSKISKILESIDLKFLKTYTFKDLPKDVQDTVSKLEKFNWNTVTSYDLDKVKHYRIYTSDQGYSRKNLEILLQNPRFLGIIDDEDLTYLSFKM